MRKRSMPETRFDESRCGTDWIHDKVWARSSLITPGGEFHVLAKGVDRKACKRQLVKQLRALALSITAEADRLESDP